MRLKIYLKNEKGIIYVPFDYNHILSAIIYNMIDDVVFANKLHSSKSFKFFTFSKIYISKFKRVDGGFISKDGLISFIISSPDDKLITELVNGLMNLHEVKFMGQNLFILKCEILKNPRFSNIMEFKTLSPIVVNTLKEVDGTLKIWDLAPGTEFYGAIENNLIKKFKKFYNLDDINKNINVYSNMKSVKRKRICINKGKQTTYHRAYLMDIILEGDVDLIEFAYQCGLSSKNSQGFGMIDVLECK